MTTRNKRIFREALLFNSPESYKKSLLFSKTAMRRQHQHIAFLPHRMEDGGLRRH